MGNCPRRIAKRNNPISIKHAHVCSYRNTPKNMNVQRKIGRTNIIQIVNGFLSLGMIMGDFYFIKHSSL